MADWSELTKDVLQFIASKLELRDYHRFSAVCQNWNSAATAKRYPPAKQLPWLLLGEDEKTKKRVFFSLPESKHYYMDMPELQGRVCRGSSYGWVFTIDRELDGHLLNPLTRHCFKLPPLPDYVGNLKLEDCKALLGKERCRMQCCFVRKAILSNNPSESNDFALVITFGANRDVAFWRPGDSNWSMVNSPYRGCYIFPGKILCTFSGLCSYHRRFRPPSKDDTGWSLSLYSKRINANTDLTEEEFAELVRYATDEEAHRHFVTKELVVFELDLERGTCCKRGDIDGFAIFVGSGSLVVLDPSQVSGCVPDRISYTGIVNELFGFSRTGFYDMVSETIGEYSPSQIFIHHPVCPTWFTPNPW